MSSKAALQKIIKASGVSEPAVIRVLAACGETGAHDTELAIGEARDIVAEESDGDKRATKQKADVEAAVKEGSKELGTTAKATTTSASTTKTD